MITRSLNIVKKMASFGKKVDNASKAQKNKKQGDEFQAFTQKMNGDVYEEYKKKIQKDTILRNFRKQIFKKEEICEEFIDMQRKLAHQQQELDKMVSTGTKQDVIKYSKKIMEKLLNKKKIFRENSINPVFSDYGDYSSYKQNYAKLQDRNLVDGQRLDVDKGTEKVYQFIQSLPDDYQQKQQVKQHIRNQFDFSFDKMSISDYGKIQQAKSDLADHMSRAQQDAYDKYVYGKQIPITSDLQHQNFDKALRGVDPDNFNLGKSARLSPQAVNTIYELYLQGWTVRQISKRFGILPQRTKFCVWARAIFYDELLPKYGVQYLIDCLQEQAQLGQQFGYQDYGIDLDKLSNSRMPQEIIQWNPRRVDSQRKPEQYIYALKTLDEKKKFSKYQQVQVGTHGTQNAMYSLKEWKIFRGRGSDQKHLREKTFRSMSKEIRKMVKTYY